MSTVSRRAFVLGAAGLFAAGCSAPAGSTAPALPLPPSSPPPAPAESRTVFRALSYARGRDIKMIVYRPDGVDIPAMPVCLAMHDHSDDAEAFGRAGVVAALTEVVRGGGAPFAVAAVDGGAASWTKSGQDDPGRMIREEVPVWLTRLGLASTPFGALGVGTGAYGALDFVTQGFATVSALVDPTLFESWADARDRGGVSTEAAWRAADPFAVLPRLREVAMGVWSRAANPQAGRFAEAAAAEVAEIGKGGDTALRTALTFLGARGIRIEGGY